MCATEKSVNTTSYGFDTGSSSSAPSFYPDWCSKTAVPSVLSTGYGAGWDCEINPDGGKNCDPKTSSAPTAMEQMCGSSDAEEGCRYVTGMDGFESRGHSMVVFQTSLAALRSLLKSKGRTPMWILDATTPAGGNNSVLWEEPINQPTWLENHEHKQIDTQFMAVGQIYPPPEGHPATTKLAQFQADNKVPLDGLYNLSQKCAPWMEPEYSPSNRLEDTFSLHQWMTWDKNPGAFVGMGTPTYILLTSFIRAPYSSNSNSSDLECSSSQNWNNGQLGPITWTDTEVHTTCGRCHYPWQVLNTTNGTIYNVTYTTSTSTTTTNATTNETTTTTTTHEHIYHDYSVHSPAGFLAPDGEEFAGLKMERKGDITTVFLLMKKSTSGYYLLSADVIKYQNAVQCVDKPCTGYILNATSLDEFRRWDISSDTIQGSLKLITVQHGHQSPCETTFVGLADEKRMHVYHVTPESAGTSIDFKASSPSLMIKAADWGADIIGQDIQLSVNQLPEYYPNDDTNAKQKQWNHTCDELVVSLPFESTPSSGTGDQWMTVVRLSEFAYHREQPTLNQPQGTQCPLASSTASSIIQVDDSQKLVKPTQEPGGYGYSEEEVEYNCTEVHRWSFESSHNASTGHRLTLASAYQNLQAMSSKSTSLKHDGKGRVYFLGTTNDKTVRIFAMTPKQKTAWRPEYSVIGDFNSGQINELYYMGAPQSINAADNSMWLWVSVNRTIGELQSLDRVVDMCQIAWGEEYYEWLTEKYKTNGIMLEPEAITKIKINFESQCNPENSMYTPTRPGLFDFVQWSSTCREGTMCPYSSTPFWEQTGGGNYASLSVSKQPCPEGSFCPMGIKEECPPGFTCGTMGLDSPNRCVPKDGYTCYTKFTGLTAPNTCAKGFTCGVPYLPPLPVGPGLYDASDDDHIGEPVLKKCSAGQYCNLGCHTGNLNSTCSCPGNTTCPEATIEMPYPCLGHYSHDEIWDCDKTGRTMNPPLCKAGMSPYCPASSTKKYPLCPAGFYCENPDSIVACSQGYYCPIGTILQAQCPSGSYCPTPGEKYICPSRHYCVFPAVAPQSCGIVDICGEGSTEPFSLAPFIALLLVIILSIFFWRLFKYLRAQQRASTDAMIKERKELKRRGGSIGSGADIGGDYVSFDDLEGVEMETTERRESGLLMHQEVHVSMPLIEGEAATPRTPGGTPYSPRTPGGSRRVSMMEALKSPRMIADAAKYEITEATLGGEDADEYVHLTEKVTSGMVESTARMDIEFEGLSLQLPPYKPQKEGGGKFILQGVDGAIRSGRVCALMGPSGAGKTSLLSALANKATYGEVAGNIKINGRNETLSKYKKLMGFVPQEDIMHRMLTVHENITMSAMLRMDYDASVSDRRQNVSSVIETLQLTPIRHERIGDENTRGISGGQRKRVNIGMEMVAQPRILFLDEPTSGLDSTSSQQVCDSMTVIARSNLVTVAAVIHQPRYEIFTTIDDCIFLCPAITREHKPGDPPSYLERVGGRVVYCGPTKHACSYFDMISYPVPDKVNPPDHFMDVIAGQIKPEQKGMVPVQGTNIMEIGDCLPATPDELVGMWENLKRISGERGFQDNLYTEPVCTLVVDPDRATAGMMAQIWLFTKQCTRQQSRELLFIGLDLGLLLIGGLFLGITFNDHKYFRYQPPLPAMVYDQCPGELADICKIPIRDMIPLIASMCGLVMALTGSIASLRLFGAVKTVYYRDRARGSSALAFFLGRSLAHLPNILMWPFAFLIVYFPLASPQGAYGSYYFVLLSMQFAASSWGYLVSIVVPEKLSYLAAVVVMLAQMMFSGANPTLPMINVTMSWAAWVPNLVFLRWSQEALYVTEVYPATIADPSAKPRIENTMSTIHNYGLDDFWFCIFATIAIGVVLRTFACLALTFMNRDKQAQI